MAHITDSNRDNLTTRLWRRVDVGHPLGCWEWTGYRTAAGYGRMNADRAGVGVHRVAYELMKGPIPDGLTIDHLCYNPPCVNPDHLEAVTARENFLMRSRLLTMRASRRGQCVKGHIMADSAYISPDGARRCRVCQEASRPKRQRQAAAKTTRELRARVERYRKRRGIRARDTLTREQILEALHEEAP